MAAHLPLTGKGAEVFWRDLYGIYGTPCIEEKIGPDCLMYRTDHHPDGRSLLPEYEIREMAL